MWKDTTKVSFCFILTHCSCPHCLVHITYRWLEALEISVLSLCSELYICNKVKSSVRFFVSIDSLLPSGQWHCGLDETDAGGLNRKQWSQWQTALLYKDLSTRRMNPTALKCSLVDHQPLEKASEHRQDVTVLWITLNENDGSKTKGVTGWTEDREWTGGICTFRLVDIINTLFKCLMKFKRFFLYVCESSLLCSLRLHLFDKKCCKNSNTVKYYCNLK